MGSIKIKGTPTRKIKCCDDDANIFTVIKYEITQQSKALNPSGMKLRASLRYYFELEDGRPVVEVEGKTDTFQIVETNKIIWKL